MALIQCKECGKDVSTEADKCPHCGYPIKQQQSLNEEPPRMASLKTQSTETPTDKKGMGVGKTILIIIGLIILLGIIGDMFNDPTTNTSSVSTSTSEQNAQDVFKMGETVTIGYMSYAVWSAIWSDRLSNNSYVNQPPNAMYLIVDLTIHNNDKEPRTIPPFKLIAEDGSEYETSSNSFLLENSIGLLDSLNPDVQQRGYIVFDVPNTHTYKLQVSGGYWSGEDALISIVPQ